MLFRAEYQTSPAEPTHGKDESINFKLSYNGSLCPKLVGATKIFIDWMKHNFVIKDDRKIFVTGWHRNICEEERNEISVRSPASSINT